MSFTTTFFQMGDVTGTADTNADGVRIYTVTHTLTGHTTSSTVAALALRVAREWVAQAPVVAAFAQIESPLPAAERCASGLARGATLTMPTEPQARALAKVDGEGFLRRFGVFGVGHIMLRALARRGWVDLDHPIRPLYGRITSAGRRALAAYERKHGPVLDGAQ